MRDRGGFPWQRFYSRREGYRLNFLLLALFYLLVTKKASAIKLRFGERECVSQLVTEKSYVTGSFVALPPAGGLFGDKARYDLQVTNPHGKRIYSALQQTEDKFSFKARYAGRYQFCLTLASGGGLGVALSSGNGDVLWEVHVGHTWRHGLEAGPHPTEPLWALLESMEQDLQDIQAVHHYLHALETRSRLLVERTGTKIISYALVRWITLIGVSVFQVAYIRRLFNNSHPSSGPNRC